MTAARRLPLPLRAAIASAVFSGLPSTVHSVATHADVLEPTLAAGSMLLPRERRQLALLAAGVVVHGAVSLGWSVVLTACLPRRHTVLAGAAAGVGIAVLDLRIAAVRFPRVAALHRPAQLADHLAFGAVVGLVVARHREN